MNPTRRAEVPAERLAGWVQRFAERHGELDWDLSSESAVARAADGSVASVAVPFPPLVGDLVAHVERDRRVGVLLVRRGGYAAGVFEGVRLVDSKVGTRLVQGRTAAGGQSQQRFARRRDNQAKRAFSAAADCAVRVLVPAAGRLDAVVLGGDRPALDATLADPRLAPLRPLVTARVLTVVDPRLRVLQATPALFRGVVITLTDP